MIDKILPIIALVLGWGLSEFGKFYKERKDDRRKFKRLLFNLLELRWLLKREFDLNEEITIYIERIKQKLSESFGNEAAQGTDLIRPLVTGIIKDKLVDPEHIKAIEANIDSTITELAEVNPVFAYELNGKYRIKERIDNAEQYFEEVSQFFEDVPKEIIEWIQPKITKELLMDLENHIIEIAEKVNKKTKKNVIYKFKKSKVIDTGEIDKFFDEYIHKINILNKIQA